MLRILFVTGSLMHGGAERHAVTLMNRLTERGHEVHAVYVKDDRPNQASRLNLRGGACCLAARRYLDPRAVAVFSQLVGKVAPDVIVAANAYALMYAGLARGLAGSRCGLVATWHSTKLLGAKEFLQMLAYRLFFWTSDRLVFVCERQRRHWLRRGVFARGNHVIYNGVDTDAFRCDAGAKARQRVALGLAGDEFVVGLSAWLRPEKNHVQLVDAIARLRGMGIRATALMIGDGETRPAVEARARERGIEAHVRITGFVEDVRPWIAACDAMVLCSFTEAFSLAAIESMALGKPVIHTDVGGASEMIRDGRDGFLFPVGDTGALTSRLAALADGALSARMGAQARLAVESRFSERQMVDRYEALIGEVAAARH